MGILFCSLFSSQNLSAKEVTPAEFWQLEQTPNTVIIDVRSPAEFKQGHLPSAMNIPFDQIAQLEAQVKEKDRPILLYCRSGQRARIAEQQLNALGYPNTFNGMSYQQLLQAKP
ncbi:rhodanese-like domain-containing protein [Photobacterium damselae subsp. damselae]|nr:rhodanese-like domain-containing protein [Photobacterium damselae subsp. damselae]